MGLGVASAGGSVLGGENLSTLGPASDIRGNIKDLLTERPGWKRGSYVRELDRRSTV